MQKTSNFNLNKPEAADPMRLEDFNQNADLIDAALANLTAAVPKIAVGTYTGDGSTTAKTIDVGFAPKMVFVWANWKDDSSTYSANYCGMVVQGQALQNILTLTSTGFQVKSTKDSKGYQEYPFLNANQLYFYFAVG